ELLTVACDDGLDGRTRTRGIRVNEQEHFRSFVPDLAVGTTPLPARLPHCQPLWKASRDLIAEKHLPLEFADRTRGPRETKVQCRAQLCGCRRAALHVDG